MTRNRRRQVRLALLLAAAILALAVCPFIGMQHISMRDVLTGNLASRAHTVFWQIRIPRVGLAFLAGAGLAVCGAAFQAMFRNPLATPFTLGVASGAALGAAVAIRCGLTFVFAGIAGTSMFAFLGALGTVSLVYGLTRIRHGFSTATMLLAGVAVSLFCASLILFTQYISDFTQSFRILRWLMGGLDVMGTARLFGLAPMILIGAVFLFLLSHELNLLATGEDIATSRGVDVTRTKTVLFLATSLTVGGIVSVCGPIGFVGMIVPHICRLLVGPNHRFLMPAAFLFGGLFLTVCDAFARTVIAPAEIPVGVVTALLGGPFFVWLLVRNPGQHTRPDSDG